MKNLPQRNVPGNRRAIRKARRAVEKARIRAARGAFTKHEPAGESERRALDELKEWLLPNTAALQALVGGTPDAAILLTVPDDDDRAYLRALADLATLEGRADAAERLRGMADARASLVPVQRRALVDHLASEWHPRTLTAALDPPPGAIPIIYSGTACGHGTFAILPAGLMVAGGSA